MHLGTNAGAPRLAFQGWHHFKEAFAPELVELAVRMQAGPVRSCLDPFGGSGTTALASQFLGIPCTTVEVNPFLADVILAKTGRYDPDALAGAFGALCSTARSNPQKARAFFAHLPATFVSPGASDRWLFDEPVADRLASLVSAIDQLEDPSHARLFRVILGGLLVEVSNVVINGKGRRYRRRWEERPVAPETVDELFRQRAVAAISDIHRFSRYVRPQATVILGDARKALPRRTFDLAVFSPPYPNSFDYTDVYNIELWILGYLRSSDDNRRLRGRTLTSHVQLQRAYAPPPLDSPTLDATLARLEARQATLWSKWIPSMVGAYFHDMCLVLRHVASRLRDAGSCWIIVGDSKYGGVHVPTGEIIAQLAEAQGWDLLECGPSRSMRSSAQHGGQNDLAETLLVLGKSRNHVPSAARASR